MTLSESATNEAGLTAREIEQGRKDLELAMRVAEAIRWEQAPAWATHYRLLPTAGLWLSSKDKAEQILLAPLFGAMTATEAMCVPMHLSTFERPNPRDERETERPVFGRGEPGHVADVDTTEGRAALNAAQSERTVMWLEPERSLNPRDYMCDPVTGQAEGEKRMQRYDRAIDDAVDAVVAADWAGTPGIDTTMEPYTIPQRGDIAYAEQLGGVQTWEVDPPAETPLQAAEREFRSAYVAKHKASSYASDARKETILADEAERSAMAALEKARKHLLDVVLGDEKIEEKFDDLPF